MRYKQQKEDQLKKLREFNSEMRNGIITRRNNNVLQMQNKKRQEFTHAKFMTRLSD